MSTLVTEEPPGEAAPVDAVASAPTAADRPAHVARPPLFYGWIMLPISMAALIASSPGQTFGVSILNEPMRLSLGLGYGQLAAAYMLGTMFGALPISLVGYAMDRYGLRRTMLLAVTLFAGACLVAASVQGWLTLVLAFFLLRSIGPGALAFLSSNTLAFWFDRRLGMVEGLRQIGMAVAMAFIPMLNLWLVASWGWRGAYAWLGIGIWLILFPTVWFCFRERPEEVGQAIDGGRPASPAPQTAVPLPELPGLTLGEALRTTTFWIVAGGTIMYGAIHTAVFFCLVPIFQERGLREGDAAAALTVYALAYAVMQLVGGTLADRMPARSLLCLGLAGLGASMFLLQGVSTTFAAQLFGIALGAAQGLYFGSAQPLFARFFGRRHLGKIRGVLMTMIVGTSSLGPLFAGLVRDWRGDFQLALLVFAVAPLPLALLSLLVRKPPAAALAASVGDGGAHDIHDAV